MDAVTAAVAAALPAAGRVWVGYSGGRDSTVLLHAVAKLCSERVVAVHVNHHLHPDADAWQRRAAAFASGLGVVFEFHDVTVAPRGSLEAEARDARYRVFSALLEHPADRLLLAHHRHDQSETVLLRLLQGRGGYGMPRERPLGRGLLVRPLIDLAPEALAAYASAHALTWVEDPANLDPGIDRSFLRHRVLPLLRERWPDADRRLVDLMEAERGIDARRSSRVGDPAPHALPLAALAHEPAAERVELVRVWLQGHAQRVPSRRALAELLRQAATAGRERQPALLLGDQVLVVFDEHLHVIPPPPALPERLRLSLPAIVELPHGVLEVTADHEGFQPVGSVEVRFRSGGERLELRGHRRLLKQLLREAGLAPWLRDSLPLLFDADGLLAVPGVAIRDRRTSAAGWRVVWRPAPPFDPRRAARGRTRG